jgi:hypothetical protein
MYISASVSIASEWSLPMHAGRIVFSQVLDFLPRHEFQKCVRRYRGNYRTRTFSCRDQFLCMAFAQLTCRESLRDIETCFRAMKNKLYHVGFRGRVARSTLADANERRDWRIWADLANVLIAEARKLYADDSFDGLLEQTSYVIDSSVIDLCLSLFPWAPMHHGKGGIKLHTQLDLRGRIPCVIRITDARTGDPVFLDELIIESGALYIMDRGYVDFRRLHRFTEALASFIVRAKKNLKYRRIAYRPVDRSTGLRSDHTIQLTGPATSKKYPDRLRRVHYFDAETQKRLVFLTNNFQLDALIIARLYKCRWQIELFFKWVKQHLRVKAFYGTSPNAVKTQVWIAVSVYVLVAIIAKRLGLGRNLAQILQILSISLFEQADMTQALTGHLSQTEGGRCHNQLSLFDF